MQSMGALPIPTSPLPGLPFFAWAIRPECQWRDLADRDPHRPVACDLLQAVTRQD